MTAPGQAPLAHLDSEFGFQREAASACGDDLQVGTLFLQPLVQQDQQSTEFHC
jgi:hypothetical protein